MTPEGWQAKKLHELGFVGRGRSRHRPRNDPKLYGGDYPFVQTGDVKAAEFWITEYSQTYNEEGLKQSKIWDRGTLCITIAANIAETAVLGLNACFPDSIVGFVPNEDKADVAFIKYYIDLIKMQMQSISQGTTQDNLSLGKLETFDFIVPDVKLQRKIASIILAYDDLIENNRQRIDALGIAAQALYREWFVEMRFPGWQDVEWVESDLGAIPSGWEWVRLDSIAEINARSIRKENAPDEINYINISSVSTGSIDEIEVMSFEDAPSRARRMVEHGDTIWSTVRPNRRSYAVIMHPVSNLIVSTGFAVLTPVQVPYSYLYYSVTTDEFAEYLTNNATGSAYPAVNQGDFAQAIVAKPPTRLLEQFHSMIEDSFELSHNLQQRNRVLRETRDLLLPRLISGEVSVEGLPLPGEVIDE